MLFPFAAAKDVDCSSSVYPEQEGSRSLVQGSSVRKGEGVISPLLAEHQKFRDLKESLKGCPTCKKPGG